MAYTGIDFSLLIGSGAATHLFKAGEVIFREGDPGHEFYVVKSGQVDLRRAGRTIETLGENAIFGEMALVDDGPRSATAVAATDAVVVPVSEQQFTFMVRHTPFFSLNVMRTLVGRLRATNAAAYASP